MEQVNPREMPHELLLRRNNISITDLSSHAQQLKKDFDRTLRGVIAKSENGQVKITSATKSKIDTYDRYICDGIFEYLEDNEMKSNASNEVEKVKMDAQREEQMDKLDNSDTTPNNITTPNNSDTTPNNSQGTPKESENNSKEKPKARIGFFDWK